MLALASGAEEPNQKKRINMTLENSADTQITTANRRKDSKQNCAIPGV